MPLPLSLTDQAVAFASPYVEREARSAILASRPLVGRMVSPFLAFLVPILVKLAIQAFAYWLANRNLGQPEHAINRIVANLGEDESDRLKTYDLEYRDR